MDSRGGFSQLSDAAVAHIEQEAAVIQRLSGYKKTFLVLGVIQLIFGGGNLLIIYFLVNSLVLVGSTAAISASLLIALGSSPTKTLAILVLILSIITTIANAFGIITAILLLVAKEFIAGALLLIFSIALTALFAWPAVKTAQALRCACCGTQQSNQPPGVAYQTGNGEPITLYQPAPPSGPYSQGQRLTEYQRQEVPRMIPANANPYAGGVGGGYSDAAGSPYSF